jgi:hypothetical protein
MKEVARLRYPNLCLDFLFAEYFAEYVTTFWAFVETDF